MQTRASVSNTCSAPALRRLGPGACLLLLLLVVGLRLGFAAEVSHHGKQFISFTSFTTFQPEEGNPAVLISPPIQPNIAWDELIVSWNYRGGTNDGVIVEAQAIIDDTQTAWYHLGSWSPSSLNLPRTSVPNQRDAQGRVDTDILKLRAPAESVRLRLTFSGPADALKFLGLSFANSQAEPSVLSPNKKAWGSSLEVPERSQASYPEGISEWCSPTSISMVMAYWGGKLGRPDLDYDVPEVARAVNDPGWPGTGNWPFNTAFAGSHPGIRAYVTRFSDVSEIEQWVATGVPVVASVSYGKLKGRTDAGNGHLVVCVGFTEEGEMIMNDPGRSAVRQVYSRENFVRAWADSKNTVYLVYPESWKGPRDRFGHWLTPRE